MGEEMKVYRVFMGKPEGKRPLGRPRHRWEDGIRMDLREICRVWIGFSWLRIRTGAGSCKYGDETAGSGATESVSQLYIFPVFCALWRECVCPSLFCIGGRQHA
jgi:hypothetical protein